MNRQTTCLEKRRVGFIIYLYDLARAFNSPETRPRWRDNSRCGYHRYRDYGKTEPINTPPTRDVQKPEL